MSGIHHCCAGSQMSPAPAACLTPLALPHHLPTCKQLYTGVVCYLDSKLLFSLKILIHTCVTDHKCPQQMLRLNKRSVIQGYWLYYVAVALPSADTASSTELNTAGWWVGGIKHSKLAWKEAWQRETYLDNVSHKIKCETTIPQNKISYETKNCVSTRVCVCLSVARAYRLLIFQWFGHLFEGA